jgi:hypothetical protein
VSGMTEEIAKRSIDWLRDTGAGVVGQFESLGNSVMR